MHNGCRLVHTRYRAVLHAAVAKTKAVVILAAAVAVIEDQATHQLYNTLQENFISSQLHYTQQMRDFVYD